MKKGGRGKGGGRDRLGKSLLFKDEALRGESGPAMGRDTQS